MENLRTRRDFLKISALGLTAAFGDGFLGGAFLPAGARSGAGIKVFTTAADKRVAVGSNVEWLTASKAADVISIDHTKKFQSIMGFGAAFTDASCYIFNKMDKPRRQAVFQELFAPDRMSLNFCRACIGSSDYASKAYSFDEGEPDPEMKRFSVAHDEEYILPIIKEARSVNPDIFLFASPWSPPGWMKSNNSMLGGNMQRRSMESYAKYFVKFLRAYEANGVPVQAITVQNEVDTDQDSRMPACAWPQEYEADFVRQFLGPAFAKEGIKTEIWLIDHNYNLWGRAIAELETPELLKYSRSIAWHGYVGDPGWMTRVHDQCPDVQMYWTEGGPDIKDPNYPSDWSTWSKAFTGILRNWCRSITGWNLALDEEGKPNIGPFSCGGLITVDSKTQSLTRSGQYWALSHFSSFIKRGAVRIDSQSSAVDLHHVGFVNPDGSSVIVVTNTGAHREIAVKTEKGVAALELAPDSVTTLVWS